MVETLSEQRCHGGIQGLYRHHSAATAGAMRFAVYQPPQAAREPLPVLYWLSGLTCNEETFMIKAGAQRWATEHGLILVAPDVSPRDTALAGATGDWEFGEGAGFYLDATQSPWAQRFRMASYVAEELPGLIERHFHARPGRRGLIGHSMGGHGALTLALKHPGRWQSVSAFAPICAPTQVPWGRKALPRYLGDDPAAWAAHDACALLDAGHRFDGTVVIDQGQADRFLDEQLRPDLLEGACKRAGQPLRLRRHDGYDHSYWFIQSFIAEHLGHHARILRA